MRWVNSMEEAVWDLFGCSGLGHAASTQAGYALDARVPPSPQHRGCLSWPVPVPRTRSTGPRRTEATRQPADRRCSADQSGAVRRISGRVSNPLAGRVLPARLRRPRPGLRSALDRWEHDAATTHRLGSAGSVPTLAQCACMVAGGPLCPSTVYSSSPVGPVGLRAV